MKRTIALIMALCLALTILSGGAALADEGSYQVLVTDGNGEPVQGVMVEFCSDTECMVDRTDESGLAVFEKEPGSYTVRILKVPEGYALPDAEYPVPETPGEPTLVVLRPVEEEAPGRGDLAYVLDVPQLGLFFVEEGKYQDPKGILNWSAAYLDSGVLNITVEYYAVSPDRLQDYNDYVTACYDAYMSGKQQPEAPDPSWLSGWEHTILYELYAINGGRDEEELRAVLQRSGGAAGGEFAWLEEIGSDGDSRFFVGQYAQFEERQDEYREAMGDFHAECEALYADREGFLSTLTLYEPEWPRELAVGGTIFYESSDLEGNPLRSKAIFSEAKVTMINIWATWCPPCREELPELGKLAKEFEEQGCQIIGVCLDADNEETAAEAAALLAEAGAEYLNLWAEDYVDEVFPVQAVPTSVFVDSEGRILVPPVVGANLRGYRAALADALALLG